MSTNHRLVPTLLLLVVACGDPIGSAGSASTRTSVVFSLKDVKTSAGLNLCEEADIATLVTRQGSRVQRQQVSPDAASGCIAEFIVQVEKGPVEFVGELLGNSRPLMDGRAEHVVESDGLDVTIKLQEIDALSVETNTVGFGGPATYRFRVDAGDPIPIAANAVDTVGAIAAGARLVGLDASPCVVDSETVDIVQPREEIGHARFDIDCSGFGNIFVKIRTVGSGGPPSYQLDLVQTDPTPSPHEQTRTVPPNRDELLQNVPAGNYRIDLEVGNCFVVTLDEALQLFLEPGGFVEVNLLVVCGGETAIRIITSTSSSGGATTPTGYQVHIDNGPALGMGARDSRQETVTPGTHSVRLAGLAGFTECNLTEPNPTTVTVPAGQVGVVTFTVFCNRPPNVLVGDLEIVTSTSGVPNSPLPYTVTVTTVGTTAAMVSVGANDAARVPNLPVSGNPYDVSISTHNCTVPTGNSVQRSVVAGGTVSVTFRVDCP